MNTPEPKDGRALWGQVRSITSWGALLAFVSLFAADITANASNPAGWYMPIPQNLNLPTNTTLEMAVVWRQGSLIAVIVLIIVSLPRWQSLVALALTIGYIAYIFIMFD
jgi:hypothetical protein